MINNRQEPITAHPIRKRDHSLEHRANDAALCSSNLDSLALYVCLKLRMLLPTEQGYHVRVARPPKPAFKLSQVFPVRARTRNTHRFALRFKFSEQSFEALRGLLKLAGHLFV